MFSSETCEASAQRLLYYHQFKNVPFSILNFIILNNLKDFVRMSHLMTKPTKWLCAQRRLRSAWAPAQSDQILRCAQWITKDPSFLHVDSEVSDQTGRMPRLIWVFPGRTDRKRVRLACTRPRVRSPRPAHSFVETWSWKHFYGHSPSSADSRRAVVSYLRKNVY